MDSGWMDPPLFFPLRTVLQQNSRARADGVDCLIDFDADDRAPSPRQAKASPTSSSLPNVPLPSPPMTIRRRVRREDKNEEGHSSIDPSSGVQLIPRESGFLGLPDVNVFGVRLQSLHVCIVIGAWMIIGW